VGLRPSGRELSLLAALLRAFVNRLDHGTWRFPHS
jgi:hypothetical protein